eukprot:Nk52_evm3s2514 gene=Nk52_evmTU3s2514
MVLGFGRESFEKARVLGEEGFKLAEEEKYAEAVEKLSEVILSGYFSSLVQFPVDILANVVYNRLKAAPGVLSTVVTYAFLLSSNQAEDALKVLFDFIGELETVETYLNKKDQLGTEVDLTKPSIVESYGKEVASCVLTMSGWLSAKLNDAEKARYGCDLAVRLWEGNIQALYLRGKTSWHINEKQKCLDDYALFCEIAPEDEITLPDVYFERSVLIAKAKSKEMNATLASEINECIKKGNELVESQKDLYSSRTFNFRDHAVKIGKAVTNAFMK